MKKLRRGVVSTCVLANVTPAEAVHDPAETVHESAQRGPGTNPSENVHDDQNMARNEDHDEQDEKKVVRLQPVHHLDAGAADEDEDF